MNQNTITPTVAVVTAKDGTQKALNLPSTGDHFSNIVAAIKAEGLNGKQGLVISSPPPPQGHPSLGAAAPSSGAANTQVPLWNAATLNDIIPPKYPTPATQISLKPTDISVFMYGGNLGFSMWFSLANLLSSGWKFSTPFPANTQLKTSGYWQFLSSHTVQPTDSYTDSTQYTIGTSSTDSVTLSAELGMSGGGFSSKMSGSTTYTNTLTTQSQQTHSNTITGAKGKVLLWVLWQYIEVYEVVDGSGNPISYTGVATNGVYTANITFASIQVENQTNYVTTNENSFTAK